MRTRTGVVRWALAGVVALVLALAGCGGAAESGEDEASDVEAAPSEPVGAATEAVGEPSDVGTGEPSETAVAADVTVVLGEWIVEPTPTSAAAGDLTFTADNRGGRDHEMVVARADDPADLPTDADGAVDEKQIPEDDIIGEIEEFPTGEQRTATFDMDPGSYVLFCNVTEPEDGGEVLSHFAEGMATTFTVD